MVNSQDFSWSEVGNRIRDLRLRLGVSQQALASSAGLTQNGIFRLEAGETNPQLSTLQRIASALGCSVRELVVGIPADDPALAQLFRRVKRVIESKDPAAIRAMDNGIETAEDLLDRIVRKLKQPPLKRILRGQGRHNMAKDLFWQRTPSGARSETSQIIGVQEVQKARKAFRKLDMNDETKKISKRP